MIGCVNTNRYFFDDKHTILEEARKLEKEILESHAERMKEFERDMFNLDELTAPVADTSTTMTKQADLIKKTAALMREKSLMNNPHLVRCLRRLQAAHLIQTKKREKRVQKEKEKSKEKVLPSGSVASPSNESMEKQVPGHSSDSKCQEKKSSNNPSPKKNTKSKDKSRFPRLNKLKDRVKRFALKFKKSKNSKENGAKKENSKPDVSTPTTPMRSGSKSKETAPSTDESPKSNSLPHLSPSKEKLLKKTSKEPTDKRKRSDTKPRKISSTGSVEVEIPSKEAIKETPSDSPKNKEKKKSEKSVQKEKKENLSSPCRPNEELSKNKPLEPGSENSDSRPLEKQASDDSFVHAKKKPSESVVNLQNEK